MEGYQPNKYNMTHFNNLMPYEPKQNFLQLMRTISNGVKESKNLEDKIGLVTELRRMWKFQSDLFAVTFSNIYLDFTNNMLLSEHSELVYHSLGLISEIFLKYEFCEGINDCMSELLFTIFELSVHQIEEIKNQANITLYNASFNFTYYDTLLVVFKCLNDSNEEISVNAYNYFLMFIKSIDALNLEQNFHWFDSLSVATEMIQSSPRSYLERLRIVLGAIETILGGKFESFLSSYLDEEYSNLIVNFMRNQERAPNVNPNEIFNNPQQLA